VRACREENPDAPALTSIHHRQSEPSDTPDDRPQTGALEFRTGDELRKLRTMDRDERIAYWQHHMARCIKCYGCRDVCPVFVDSECQLEKWAEPGRLPPDAPLYHVARAYYIAARCTNCGFCEDTCPSRLPLRTLVDVIRHEDPDRLFDFVPGLPRTVATRIRRAFPQPKEAPA
jgi:Fe-S oxidoreductase